MQNNQAPLITVVVPIYKVEEYLDECVQSILNQTYHNLEIFLVDDGSPDRCGEMCDTYAEKDARVKVIHQKNKGLSGARNSAIDIATGEYITFVDSDDYLKEDMIEVLYREALQYGAEITTAAFESFFEDGTKSTNPHGGKIFVYTKEKALDCFLFNDYLTPCVCGKLYSISLWKSVRCPEGKLFEDQFTTYKLIDQCKKIVFDTTPRYYYRKRMGSIGHSSFSKRTYDLYDAIHEEYNYISRKYPKECPNIAVAKITWEIVFVNMMIRSDAIEAKTVVDVQQYARKNIKKVFRCRYINGTRKLQIILFSYAVGLYKVMYKKFIEKKATT